MNNFFLLLQLTFVGFNVYEQDYFMAIFWLALAGVNVATRPTLDKGR